MKKGRLVSGIALSLCSIAVCVGLYVIRCWELSERAAENAGALWSTDFWLHPSTIEEVHFHQVWSRDPSFGATNIVRCIHLWRDQEVRGRTLFLRPDVTCRFDLDPSLYGEVVWRDWDAPLGSAD